jgi:hypothetical protein
MKENNWCKCGMEEIESARLALGYTTCLTCGEEAAKLESARKSRRIAIAYDKGAYQYITDETNLADLG